MEKTELIKRGEDLQDRCVLRRRITHTHFLTPAEQHELETRLRRDAGCTLMFFGGSADCERNIAFFLPDYLTQNDFRPDEFIAALQIEAFFGKPGHRDYLGALLAMGVERDRIGDIRIKESTAYIFCEPEILNHICTVEKVGRCGVKTKVLQLDEVPAEEHRVRTVQFSVMSARLDAVVAGMFCLSRTQAAKHIALGDVSLNYNVTLRQDISVNPGDVISLRGKGKGTLSETGGTSRKGRTFLTAEIRI